MDKDPFYRILENKSKENRILTQISINILPDVLNKSLDIINTDKTCFFKINVESSPKEISIRISFLEKIGSPSPILSLKKIKYNVESYTKFCHYYRMFLNMCYICNIHN